MLRLISPYLGICSLIILLAACSKSGGSQPAPPVPPTPSSFSAKSTTINGISNTTALYHVKVTPEIKFSFGAPIDHNSVSSSISFKTKAGSTVTYNSSYENNDSNVIIKPAAALNYVTAYTVNVATSLKSKSAGPLKSAVTV
ncbi:MAG: Ig-like domain-containing protein, partial [Panacibacter sp.]